MNKFKSYVAGGVARIKNAPRPKAFLLWATAASFGLSLVFTLVPAGAQSKGTSAHASARCRSQRTSEQNDQRFCSADGVPGFRAHHRLDSKLSRCVPHCIGKSEQR